MTPIQKVIKSVLAAVGAAKSRHISHVLVATTDCERVVAALAALQSEIEKYVDPTNENVRVGDHLAALRDLVQVKISATQTCERLERMLEEYKKASDHFEGR